MPKAAAAAVPIAQIEQIPIEQIHESPLNPRKTFEGIEELAEDVRQRGVLQPILVRPNADIYQVIFGARRFRAAGLAGLKTIPAMVRIMSDVEALEVAIIENSKRADVHPLEEADAYRELHTKHGYDVDTIAAKVGKSRAAVYARMKLCELGEAGREALLADKISASVALLIARVPIAQQADAVGKVLGDDWRGPMSVRQASQILQGQYTKDLIEAPFSLKDAKLLPEAGPCTTCPKRSGNNPDLFNDLDGKDICTDTKCFKAKCEAIAEKRLAEAAQKGQEVLEAKGLFEYGSTLSNRFANEFEDLAHFSYTPGDGESQRYRDLVPKDAPIVLAKDPNGLVHELMRRKDLKAALEQAGHKKAAEGVNDASWRDNYAERQAKEDKARKLRGQVATKARELLVERLQKKAPDTKWWRALARLLAVADDGEITKAGEEQLRALILKDALEHGGAFGVWQGYTKTMRDLCDEYRVDLKAIEKKLKAEAKQKAKPAAKKGRAA